MAAIAKYFLTAPFQPVGCNRSFCPSSFLQCGGYLQLVYIDKFGFQNNNDILLVRKDIFSCLTFPEFSQDILS